MNKEKQFVVNMFASLLTFAISFAISFFFTPYITKTVGGEAYGFVGLANNMINYITILTVALNSVAGRFITVKYHQNQKEEANQYFSSVLIANIVIAIVISIIAIPLILRLEYIIHISSELVVSVKQLFVFVYLNFILTLVGTVFTTATFITNKLYLSSIANIVAALTKVILLLVLYGVFPVNVAYIGVATCISTLITLVLNIVYTKRLIPDISIKRRNVSLSKVKELCASGIWNSISRLSQVLSDGLDLLITNLWISPFLMGQLSIAQTIPNYIASLASTLISLFSPNLTMYYAKNQIDELVEELKSSMKLSAFFCNIIFAIVLVYGDYFFEIWVPEQDTALIYRLSVVIIMSVLISGVVTPLNNVFLVTNRLRTNSIVWLLISGLNVALVLILLNTTSMGVYAVAGVSKFTGIIVNAIYLPIHACQCLKIKKTTFYPLIGRYILTTFVMVGAFGLIRLIYITPTGWISFIGLCILGGIVGCILNFTALFDKKERNIFTNKFFRIIKK